MADYVSGDIQIHCSYYAEPVSWQTVSHYISNNAIDVYGVSYLADTKSITNPLPCQFVPILFVFSYNPVICEDQKYYRLIILLRLEGKMRKFQHSLFLFCVHS